MRIVVKVGTSTLAYATGRLNIRHTEDLCLRIRVDRYDTFRSVHTGRKLDRSGYATGDDQLRTHGTTGQTDLMRRIAKSVFYHRTGKCQLTAKRLCQFPAHFHIFFISHATACYDQHILFFQALDFIDHLRRKDLDS